MGMQAGVHGHLESQPIWLAKGTASAARRSCVTLLPDTAGCTDETWLDARKLGPTPSTGSLYLCRSDLQHTSPPPTVAADMHRVGPPCLGYRPLGPQVAGPGIDGLSRGAESKDWKNGIFPQAYISHGESSTIRLGPGVLARKCLGARVRQNVRTLLFQQENAGPGRGQIWSTWSGLAQPAPFCSLNLLGRGCRPGQSK